MLFQSKKPHYQGLKKKWVSKHKVIQKKLWDNHGNSLNDFFRSIPGSKAALGTLGGLMLLTTPTVTMLPPGHSITLGDNVESEFDTNKLLAEDLDGKVPKEVRSLSKEEEVALEKVLSESFGFEVKAEIDGKRLNRSYGLIGGEQHLYRYPGDTLEAHADSAQDWAMYGSSGIAPGLGAWGYFAPSKTEFTEQDKLRERYYLAVQTFLAPGFAERTAEYRDFFKFRKMLVVNPETGQAVVAVIGDAGPAEFTGKHLGGSPEVMHYVGLARGPRKGAVLYFFINDPEDKVPLGPVKAIDKSLASN